MVNFEELRRKLDAVMHTCHPGWGKLRLWDENHSGNAVRLCLQIKKARGRVVEEIDHNVECMDGMHQPLDKCIP